MRKTLLRGVWISLSMLFAVVYVIYQADAHSNGQGIGGHTQKDGNTSGCTCHCASSGSGTTVAFSTTATNIYKGNSYTFTVTVSNGSQSGAGVEVSAQRGTLTSGTGSQIINGELTHSSAKTSLPATWTFTYNAPSTSGSDTLFGTGNAVNLDGSNGGGNCTDVWNFSPKYVINVQDPPITKAIAIGRNSIALGNIRVGNTKKDTLKISSTSTAAITVNTSLKSGAAFTRFPTSADRSIASGSSEIDTVYLSPSTRGNFTDSLIITSNVDVATDQRKAVYLTGTGIQAIFSGGSSLAFNNLRNNLTKTLGFVYSNTGDDTLFMQSPSISGSGFTILTQPTKLTMPPGSNDSVVVKFSPIASQAYNGSLTLSATGFTIPSVTLTGTGVAPIIGVTSPANIGGVRIGAQTQGTIAVRNTGTDSLHLSGVALSGSNAARFNVASFSPVIAPGGQGVVQINYFPLTEKLDTAIATISSDDPSTSTSAITVIAQGLAPHMSVLQMDTLDFGNVRINSAPASRDISVQNTGSDVLNLASAIVTPLPFSLKSKPSSVDVGITGVVSVNFAPTTVGPFKGSVIITSDDAKNPSTTVYVKGVGINSALNIPSNLDFGGLATATSADSVITLQNTGAAGVNILKYSLSDPNSVFTIKDSSAHSIAGNTSIHVTMSFKPTSATNYSGTLTLTTDDPNASTLTIGLAGHGLSGALSLSSTSLDFGPVDSAKLVTKPIDITNTGASAIGITSLVISGTNASTFGVQSTTPTLPASLPPSQKLHAVISFEPIAAGSYSAKLTITTSDLKTTVVNLSGIGKANVPIVADTTTVDLESTTVQHIFVTLNPLGAKSWISRFRNSSPHPAKIDAISLRSGGHFSQSLAAPDSTFPFLLADSASMYVRLTLNESALGEYRDTLLVSSELGITSTAYAIDAILTSAGVAMTQAKSFSITANPNPTHNQVVFNLGAIHAADVTVLDLMGKVVAEAHNINAEWRWNGQNLAGLDAPTGFYIVRANGRNAAGETLTSTMQIVIQH